MKDTAKLLEELRTILDRDLHGPTPLPIKILRGAAAIFYSRNTYTAARRLDTQLYAQATRACALSQGSGSDQAVWAQVISHLLDAAKARRHGHTEAAWWHLNCALRAEVPLMSDVEFDSEMITLRQEVTDKLSAWRARSALGLIDKTTEENLSRDEQREYGVKALEIRDQHSDNMYRNKDVLKSHISLLLAPMMIGITIFAFAFYHMFPDGCLPTKGETLTCLTDDFSSLTGKGEVIAFLAACFGLALIGASISAITGMVKSRQVPNQFDNPRITLDRAFAGGTSGALAFFITDAEIFSGLTPPSQTLMLAFALGFSEKLFAGVMDRMNATANQSDPEPPKKPTKPD